jgi:hypothetical protein
MGFRFPSAANSVHEETADDAAWQVEAVYDGSVSDVLDYGIIWIELGDYGWREEAKGVSYEIVAKPGEGWM